MTNRATLNARGIGQISGRAAPLSAARARTASATFAFCLLAALGAAAHAQAPATTTGDPAYSAAESGYRAFAEGRAAEAADLAGQAIALRPDTVAWHLLLIDAHIASGQLAAADGAARNAAARFPGDAAVRERQARLVERVAAERARTAATRIDAHVDAGRMAEARAELSRALDDGSLDGMNPADAGYLALRAGDDAAALTMFERAEQRGRLAAPVSLDAGYAARRLNERRTAIRHFNQGLQAPGAESIEPERRFGIQRDIATLEQWWGGSAIVTHGPVGLASGGLPSAAGRRDVTQAGGELFVRPYDLQPRGGGTVEGFVRYFQTLADAPGAPTGGDTGQGSIGLRWRPWDTTNAVFEIARLVKIGDVSRNDTQLRAAWSHENGTDAPYAGSSWPGWPGWRLYAEANRFLETHQTVAQAEAQWGHVLRIGADSHGVPSRATLFPHVLLATSYDSSLARPSATSTGVGITHRLPVGEPWGVRSVGWSLQYRARLGGDRDRARGLFLQVFASF